MRYMSQIPYSGNHVSQVKHYDKEQPMEFHNPTAFEYENVMNDKQRKNFISKIEKAIRGSMEYGNVLIPFLKHRLGLNYCAFYNNMSTGTSKMKIELHHSPFTLYSLVEICIRKFNAEGRPLNKLDIAEEVMRWHFEGLVGLIPLSTTVHKLVHSGNLSIPLYMPYGKKKEFYEKYAQFFGEVLHNYYTELQLESRKILTTPPEILKQEYTYLDIEGVSIPRLNVENPQKIA